jgi:hypothetical protein
MERMGVADELADAFTPQYPQCREAMGFVGGARIFEGRWVLVGGKQFAIAREE